MEARWWALPGPTRFVQAIVQDLRAGKNVVLAFPPYAPAGIREALAARVRENELWRWRTVHATDFPCDGVASLAGSLHQKLVPAQQASELSTPLALAQRLVGTIIWVQAVADPAWQTWAKFLTQYQHACQSCDLSDRSLFCLTVIGSPSPPLVPDVALSVRRWEGMVGRLDMALYLDQLLSSRYSVPLHYKTALAVVIELAGSDAQLAQHLVKEELSTIMNPFETLRIVAAERGWTAELMRSVAWQEGTCDKVDGQELMHSAAAAAMGNRAEVKRRVWRGQVAVLYPFIEEQRLKIVPKVRSYLRLPLETTYGRVDDAEDLEVGQLLYFLRGKRIQQRLWRLLTVLTEMRHALAHLEPVPLMSLFTDEVVHLDGSDG
jgi:hypothetical protein